MNNIHDYQRTLEWLWGLANLAVNLAKLVQKGFWANQTYKKIPTKRDNETTGKTGRGPGWARTLNFNGSIRPLLGCSTNFVSGL